jgi:2-isopropylmalate synthase
MHTDGVIKNPKTYEAFEPSLIGRERKIVVDRYTGKLAARQRLEEYGISVNDDELLSIVMEIKKQGDEYKFIHDTDIIAIAERITGRRSVIIPKGIDAVIFVSAESHTYTTSIVRKLSNFPGIVDVFEVTGENDIGAYIQVKNTTELNNVIEHIRTLPGVLTTNTHIVLKKYPGKNGNGSAKPDTTVTKTKLLD